MSSKPREIRPSVWRFVVELGRCPKGKRRRRRVTFYGDEEAVRKEAGRLRKQSRAARNKPDGVDLPQAGFIYLIKPDHMPYKIGLARDVDGRVRSLAGLLPYRVRLIHTVMTDDVCEVESYFHNVFSQRRVKGEWFDLLEEKVEWFKRLKIVNRDDLPKLWRYPNLCVPCALGVPA